MAILTISSSKAKMADSPSIHFGNTLFASVISLVLVVIGLWFYPMAQGVTALFIQSGKGAIALHHDA